MPEPDESPAILFQRVLKASPALADALVSGGITSIEEVAYIPFARLQEISNETVVVVTELRRVARMRALSGDLSNDLDY